jgi:hypothetical protein
LQSDTAATAKHITCEALAAAGTPCPPKVSPGSLNFGEVALGTTSAAQTVTITNTLSTTLTFGTISLVGADPGDFGISANTCGSSLAAGASCTISLTFTPGAAGALTANLQINESGSGSPLIVALKGSGQ